MVEEHEVKQEKVYWVPQVLSVSDFSKYVVAKEVEKEGGVVDH